MEMAFFLLFSRNTLWRGKCDAAKAKGAWRWLMKKVGRRGDSLSDGNVNQIEKYAVLKR